MKADNITATSADVSWSASEGAKSYVIRYGVGAAVADRLHYSETPSFKLTDAVFAGALAGLELHLFVEAFDKTFEGKDEIEKANAAMKETSGKWSQGLTVNFPVAG